MFRTCGYTGLSIMLPRCADEEIISKETAA